MKQGPLCEAISKRNLVQFYYDSQDDPGTRIVEPHMVAYTKDGNLALSGWYLSGHSASSEGEGWRIYVLEKISNITILDRKFIGTRPGYKPNGGATFHNVQCAV